MRSCTVLFDCRKPRLEEIGARCARTGCGGSGDRIGRLQLGIFRIERESIHEVVDTWPVFEVEPSTQRTQIVANPGFEKIVLAGGILDNPANMVVGVTGKAGVVMKRFAFA